MFSKHQENPAPPECQKIIHTTSIHGVTLRDSYFWLREKDNPEVISYLTAENTYTESVMRETEPFQEKLYQEILSRIKETDLSVPIKMDDFYYYTRTEKGKQYGIACRKHHSLEAAEEIILDLNALAQDLDYFNLGAYSISPDHSLLAYATDTTGAESYTIRIKNLTNGELFSEQIIGSATSVEWCLDNQTFFYSVLDESKRPYRIYRHRLGEDPANDHLLYEEKDQAFIVSLHTSKSRKYIFLSSSSSTTSEIYLINAADSEGKYNVVYPRTPGHEYSLCHQNNRFLVLTNENAVNFKLMEVPENDFSKEKWTVLIGHRPDVKLEGVEAFQSHFILYEREQGLMKIRITDTTTGAEHYLNFPETVYTAWGSHNPEYHSKTLRYGYTSLVTPSSIYDYDMTTRVQTLKKQSEVLGGYDSSRYITERIYAASHDGTQVPISLVYRRDLDRSKTHPLFLYGYGSYGISIDPEFSSVRLSLLDRGYIYAIAHIRGGGDLGKPWHENGKLLKKRNTFLDFISCAEHLIRKNYTESNKLVIYGGSAGGLLIGNVINERPDLFYVAVAKVPFVDIINTMLDASLPLTVGEYEEWGNPQQKEFFDYILSYSPYDNVKSQKYPHILITTGLNDPRVQYWEPAKWTCKLRDFNSGNSVVLLKTNMGAGHGGASGRYDHLREIAFDYAFVFKQMGITR